MKAFLKIAILWVFSSILLAGDGGFVLPIYGKDRSIEEKLNMKFTQHSCDKESGYAAPKAELRNDGDGFVIKASIGLNCAAMADNPLIRVSPVGVTVSVESHFPDDGVAMCKCGKILKFYFDFENFKHDEDFEYKVDKFYFVLDNAVIFQGKLQK